MNQIANHSELLLKLDLQQFAEDDMILPDDFSPEPTETIETVEDTTPTEEFESVETIEPNEPTDTEQPEQPTQPFLKVKYNHDDMELDEATARELAQKGLNYDKTLERLQALENDHRFSFVENLAQQAGMDVNDYIEAVQQYQEQEQLNQLIQQNIPEEYAREMLENRKFREQFETERQTKAQEEKQKTEMLDFFSYFKDANGRDFVPDKDQIPQSVWEANANGVPLKFAYMQHQNQQLQNQIKTLKQNESNAKKAPVGSVTKHGSQEIANEDDFLRGFNSIL